MAKQTLKTFSVFAMLVCVWPFLVACDGIRGLGGKDHTAAGPGPVRAMLIFEYLSGSGLKGIELVGQDGNRLFDPDHGTSTSISDYPEGVEFETNMVTAFFFAALSFDNLNTVRVTGDNRQLELNASFLKWQTDGPGRTNDFEYQASYRTVLDSKSKPLFQ